MTQIRKRGRCDARIGIFRTDKWRMNKIRHSRLLRRIKNSAKAESPPTYNPNPNFKKDKHWYGRYTSDFWKKDTIELSPEIWDNPSRPDQLLSTTIHEALHGTDLVPSHGLDPDSPEWKNYYDYVDQLIDDMKNK